MQYQSSKTVLLFSNGFWLFQVLFYFSMNFKPVCQFLLKKNPAVILHGIILITQINLEKIDILTIFKPFNLSTWYITPLIEDFFIFSHQVCTDFSVQVLHEFVKFILKYFIHFNATGKGIALLILLSDWLLLVYRNIIDFVFILMLSAEILVGSYQLLVIAISSRSFPEDSIGFSTQIIMPQANYCGFTYYFPNWILIYSPLTCLATVP